MSITRVQLNGSIPSGATGTCPAWAGGTPGVGNLLLLIMNMTGSGTFSDASVIAGGWTAVQDTAFDYNSANGIGGIYWMKAGASEPTPPSFTGAGASAWHIYTYEFSATGGWPTNPLDQTVHSAPLGSTANSRASGSTSALSQPDELAIAVLMVNNTITGITNTGAFVADLPTTNNSLLNVAWYETASTTALAVTFSWGTARTPLAWVATFAPSGPPTVSGTVALTQSRAAIAATGKELFTSTAAVTQARAHIAATGKELFTSTAAVTQARAAIAATGKELFTSLGAVTQPRAAIAATGKELFTGSVALVQSRAHISATGKELFTGSGNLLQRRASLSGTATEVFAGTAALVQARAHLAGVGDVVITSSGALVQAKASIAAAGNAHQVISGAVALTQARGSYSGAGRVSVIGPVVIHQPRSIIAAAGSVATTSVGAMTQGRARIAATGAVDVQGTAALVQARARLAAIGNVAVQISSSGGLIQSRAAIHAQGFIPSAGAIVGIVELTQEAATYARTYVTVISPAIGWVVDFQTRTDHETSIAILMNIALQINHISPKITVTNTNFELGSPSPLRLTLANMKVQGIIAAALFEQQDILFMAIQRVVKGLAFAPEVTELSFTLGN